MTGRATGATSTIAGLVRSITVVDRSDGPLPRFTAPICILAAGLPPPLLEGIAARLLDDAKNAGLKPGGVRCQPNIAILFADDGHAELDRLHRRRPSLFGSLTVSQIRRLVAGPGPVRVITTSIEKGRDGGPINVDVTGLRTLNTHEPSRIALATRRDLLSSVVMIDRAMAVGRTVTQLADYAAMRALARVDTDARLNGETILSLFQPTADPAPGQLTAFDRGYLAALYRGAGNQRPAIKENEIAQMIDRRSSLTSKR